VLIIVKCFYMEINTDSYKIKEVMERGVEGIFEGVSLQEKCNRGGNYE